MNYASPSQVRLFRYGRHPLIHAAMVLVASVLTAGASNYSHCREPYHHRGYCVQVL